MSNFNYWWIVAPAMMVGALILGWFITGMKGCKLHIRKAVDAIALIYFALATIVFAAMLLLESYLGFVQVGLKFIAPGESEAGADIAAIGGIILSAVAYFVLLLVCGCIGDALKQKYLRGVVAYNRRAYCRSVSREDAVAACPYSCDQKCPCGIDRRIRLNLSKEAVMGLVDGLAPLFERQNAAGQAAQCSVTLPVIDNAVSLSDSELRKLRIQAYELSQDLPEEASLSISRSFAERTRDKLRAAYRRSRASFRVVLGKRTA